MSTFIDKADYETYIKGGILDAVTEADDAKIDAAEDAAIEEMKSFLNSRYDVLNIFNKTGTARNPVLLMYAIDMTLYHLHSRINPHKIPKLRQDRYMNAINWLDMVQEGKRNPVDLPLLQNGAKDYVLTHSNPRRDNQY